MFTKSRSFITKVTARVGWMGVKVGNNKANNTARVTIFLYTQNIIKSSQKELKLWSAQNPIIQFYERR